MSDFKQLSPLLQLARLQQLAYEAKAESARADNTLKRMVEALDNTPINTNPTSRVWTGWACASADNTNFATDLKTVAEYMTTASDVFRNKILSGEGIQSYFPAELRDIANKFMSTYSRFGMCQQKNFPENQNDLAIAMSVLPAYQGYLLERIYYKYCFSPKTYKIILVQDCDYPDLTVANGQVIALTTMTMSDCQVKLFATVLDHATNIFVVELKENYLYLSTTNMSFEEFLDYLRN